LLTVPQGPIFPATLAMGEATNSSGRRTEDGNQHAAPARGTADDHHERSEKQAGFLDFQIGLKELVS